jgi:uncharacterized membrane protein
MSKPRPRIESLSDLIFGLALSIGAIALIGSPPVTVNGLYRDILTFTFNFIILIGVWLRYTRVMSVLPLETRLTVALNTLLLFCVSIEPFLFNTLRSGNSALPVVKELQDIATQLYGLDLGVIMVVMGLFTATLAQEERALVPKEMVRQLRSEAGSWLVAGAVFLVSGLPFFNSTFLFGTFVRFDLWVGALLIVTIRRSASRILSPPEV